MERPGLGLRARLRGHPHCAAEDLGRVGGVAGDVEEAVGYAPATSKAEGYAVPCQIDLEENMSALVYVHAIYA